MDSAPVNFLTVDQFCAVTGFSKATVNRLLAAGDLPKLQPGGPRCRLLIPASALAVEKQAAPSASAAHPPRLAGRRPQWTLN
jgi:excisionase family DNA binding protein